MANKYHVDPSAVLLRYILDRHLLCVVKSSDLKRIEQNWNDCRSDIFHLDKNDLEQIHKEINIRFRYYKMEDGQHAKEHPFKQWKDSL